MARFAPRDGLFLRVYTYGVLFLAGSLLVVMVLLTLAGPQEREGLLTREQLVRISALVDNPSGMQRGLDELASEGLEAAAYRWNGALIAGSSRTLHSPLSDAQRSRLRTRDALPLLTYAQPLLQQGRPVGYLLVDREGTELSSQASTTVSYGRIAWVLFAVLLVAVIISIPAARAVTAPIEKLTLTVRALGEGDLSVRSGIRRRDEVGELAAAFDEMAERMDRLVRSEKELLANISHELRTPISRLRLALEVAELDLASLDKAQIEAMTRDLAELEQMVEDVLITARLEARGRAPQGLPPLKSSEVDSNAILRAVVNRFRADHPERQLQAELASPLPHIHADPVLLRRVLDNLLDNARKYSDSQEPVILVAVGSQGALRVEVRDRGIGMQQSDIQKLFTPFFRTDRSRARGTGGVGLGLALARRIVEAHGGQLVVESMAGLGTVVRLSLPAS